MKWKASLKLSGHGPPVSWILPTSYVKKNGLVGTGLSWTANRPVGTVRSLPSDRSSTLADNTRQKRRAGDKPAQWAQTFKPLNNIFLPFFKNVVGKHVGNMSQSTYLIRIKRRGGKGSVCVGLSTALQVLMH